MPSKPGRWGVKKSAAQRARVIELHEERVDGQQRTYREIAQIMTDEGMPVSRHFVMKVLRPLSQAVSEEAKRVVVARVAEQVDKNVARMQEMSDLLANIANDEDQPLEERIKAARGAIDGSAKLLGFLGLDPGKVDASTAAARANEVYGFGVEEADDEPAGNGHATTTH